MGGGPDHPTGGDSQKDIKKLRSLTGLRPVKEGIRECMRCARSFHSNDMERVRMCEPCRAVAKRYV